MRLAFPALLCALSFTTHTVRAQEWQSVAPGVDLLEQTLPGPNRVKVLRVGLCTPGLRMRATTYEERGQRTSAWAPAAGVVAAVNGGFFEPGDPQRAQGIAIGGGVAWPGATDPIERGFIAFGANALQLSGSSEVLGPPQPWMEDAVNGDATLVYDGGPVYGHGGYCPNRHPITAVGLSPDNTTLWMVTVDGRQASSVGMTCNEMTDFLLGLGAHQALKLDGGGSTTMWVQGRGRINSPSDDSGERVVANHLGIISTGSGPPRSCMTREIPSILEGVKRSLPPQEQATGWRFSLTDLYPLGDDWLRAYPDGEPLPPGPPVIVQEDLPMNGRAYLLDGGRKRLIPSLYALVAWRFHEQTIERRAVADLAKIPDGAPVTATPLIAYSQESGAYLVDFPAPEPAMEAEPPPPATTQPKGGAVNGICAMAPGPRGEQPVALAVLLAALLLHRRRWMGDRN